MSPQQFIDEYGLDYSKSIHKMGNLWDMYYDTKKKEFTTHNVSFYCVCLEDLRITLMQYEVERVSCHAVIVWYGMIVFWLLLIGLVVWWLL